MTDLITAEEAEKLLDECDGDDCLTCEYARTVIALHAQLADAQAAQAMVVERCAEEPAQAAFRANARGPREASILHDAAGDAERAIRALAHIDGLARVQALRASCDRWKATATEGLALLKGVEAERDRLAAANAGLEAKVAGLVDALAGLLCAITDTDQIGDRKLTIAGGTEALRWLLDAEDAARAALATQEAGT